MRRGVEEGLTGLEKDSGVAVEVVLRAKLEGFRPLAGDEKREPLERLEKLTGSTFSKLPMSSRSALRLPLVGGGMARQIVSIMREVRARYRSSDCRIENIPFWRFFRLVRL